MQYVIIIYEGLKEFETRNHPEKAEAYWGAWSAYSTALEKAGVIRGGEGLQGPELATVVSQKNGKRHVQDGPYSDTKEQLGGFFIIDVPNLDAALDWAAKSPAFQTGKIEVRPVLHPVQ